MSSILYSDFKSGVKSVQHANTEYSTGPDSFLTVISLWPPGPFINHKRFLVASPRQDVKESGKYTPTGLQDLGVEPSRLVSVKSRLNLPSASFPDSMISNLLCSTAR